MVLHLVLVVLAAVLFAPTSVSAQELEWRRLAFAGANTYALAVADEGRILYLSTEFGLQVSEDGGETWLYAGQALDAVGAPPVQALAVSPADARTVYAGTNFGEGAGLYLSHDMGRTWERIWVGRRQDGIRSILVVPDDPRRILAIAVAHEGKDDELIASEDGGRSWSIVLGEAGWQSQKLYDLAVESGDATVWYVAGTPGVLVIRDSGTSWSRLSRAAGRATAVLTVPGLPGALIATGLRDLYASGEGGARWTPLPLSSLGVCEAYGRDGLALFVGARPLLLMATYSLCPGHYGHMYALGPSSDGGGVLRQVDTGLPAAESLRVLVGGETAPRAYSLTADGLWTADLAPILATGFPVEAPSEPDGKANATTVGPAEDTGAVDADAVASAPSVEPETTTPTAGPGMLLVVVGSLSGAAVLGLLMVSRHRSPRDR